MVEPGYIYTRRKTFTHKKKRTSRNGPGIEVPRQIGIIYKSMHVIINTHPCNFLYVYSYYMHVYIILYGPCLLFSN